MKSKQYLHLHIHTLQTLYLFGKKQQQIIEYLNQNHYELLSYFSTIL